MTGARIAAVALALSAPFLFPWQITALVALGAGAVVPPLPFITGVLMDALSYSRGVAHVPWWTILGALAALCSYLVRERLKASIMPA